MNSASVLVEWLLQEASKGCLMCPLSLPDASRIIKWTQDNVSPASLAEDGYEHSSHVTVLYGFNPSVAVDEIYDAVCEWSSARNQKSVTFRLDVISRFEAEEYDVLKVDVQSDDLVDLHAFLVDRFKDQVEETHPDYHPHLTLAYVKSGSEGELNGHCQFSGDIFVCDSLVFSTPDSAQKTVIPIGG